MALIHCPECGKEISDKAEKCIHCGHVMKEQPKIICEDCGNEIPEGAETCPVCGCPVKVEVEEKPIPVYLQPGTPPRKSLYAKIGKKGIAIGLAVILVLIGGGIATSKAIANQKAADAAAEAAQISADYKTNYSSAVMAMYTGAAKAETCGGLIKNVWYNAIWDKYDSETYQYTQNASDFNDALANLFSDSDFSSDISSIKSSKDTVQQYMSTLQSPPAEWENAYNALEDAYDAYLEIVNIVTSPNGSLQTFSSSFNDADTKAATTLEKALGYVKD